MSRIYSLMISRIFYIISEIFVRFRFVMHSYVFIFFTLTALLTVGPSFSLLFHPSPNGFIYLSRPSDSNSGFPMKSYSEYFYLMILLKNVYVYDTLWFNALQDFSF